MAKVSTTYTVGDTFPAEIQVGDWVSCEMNNATCFCYRVLNVARHLTDDSKIVVTLQDEDDDVFFSNMHAGIKQTIKRWIEVK